MAVSFGENLIIPIEFVADFPESSTMNGVIRWTGAPIEMRFSKSFLSSRFRPLPIEPGEVSRLDVRQVFLNSCRLQRQSARYRQRSGLRDASVDSASEWTVDWH